VGTNCPPYFLVRKAPQTFLFFTCNFGKTFPTMRGDLTIFGRKILPKKDKDGLDPLDLNEQFNGIPAVVFTTDSKLLVQ